MKRKRKSKLVDARKRSKTEKTEPPSQCASSHHLSILHLYYAHVQKLGDLLRGWLPSTSGVRQRRLSQFSTEHPQYATFLQDTIVGVQVRPSLDVQQARRDDLVTFTQTQRVARGDSHEVRTCDIEEIINFVIWTLFRGDPNATWSPSHLLCQGYARTGARGANDRQDEHNLLLPGIDHRSRNTSVEALKQSPWTNIANILGKDAELILLSLLLDCGIFQQLESGKQNLYQFSGEPVSLLRLQTLAQTDRTKPTSKSTRSEAFATPGSITFMRNRILYANPSINNQGKVQLGLKHIHVLNRYSQLTNHSQDVRILQYIFPRQFGLHNVFTCTPNANLRVNSLRDYTMREQEISMFNQTKVSKLPHRLRGSILSLIRKLRKNHSHCSYTQLLRHYCPVMAIPNSTCMSAGGADLWSRASQTLATQLCNPSITSQDTSEPVSTTSLMPHATPTHQVSAFCIAVITQLLPRNAFGIGQEGDHNWTILKCSIMTFINMRRRESMTLHNVCQNMKITSIHWLCPSSISVSAKLSASDREKRLELFYDFMYYIFDSMLIPLIRSNFYVTETGVHRNRLYYFRHDVWRKLIQPGLALMRLSMFEAVHPRQLKHQTGANSLGCSQVRLLPKDHGIRPIMNLKKKQMKNVNGKSTQGKSINAILKPVFSVFKFERQKQPEMQASALFSIGELHHQLKTFKARLNAPFEPLYFAKVDITSCFDTIPQGELMEFAQSFLLEQTYKVVAHVEMKRISTPGQRMSHASISNFISRAISADQESHFNPDTANQLARQKRGRLFVGLNQETVIKISQIRTLLTSHLQHNIVKIGRKLFKQTQGIPQGSILSSMLCNLFYGDFERQELAFLNPRQSLLLRWVDDFLLITTDQTQARKFLQAMSYGSSKHGIRINSEKSLVNFEVSIGGHKFPRLHGINEFPYCGVTISTLDLQIRKDRQSKDPFVTNGLSFTGGGKVGHNLHTKIVFSLKRQLQPMLLDGTLNTRTQVLSHIFQCFAETGMLIHSHLRCLPKHRRPSQPFVIKLCDKLIQLGHKMLNRVEMHDRVAVTRLQMSWLAAAALSRIWSRKQSEYILVLSWLRDQESRARRSMNMTASDIWRLQETALESFSGYVY